MTDKRNKIIDISRGIGIVLVILGHIVTYGNAISKFIFMFHMPLFFFLSGYVMNDDFSMGNYIHKIKTYLLPYIEFLSLAFIVTLLIPKWRSAISIKKMCLDVFYNVQPESLHEGQIWFLFALTVCVTYHFVFNVLLNKQENDMLNLLIGGGGYCLGAIIIQFPIHITLLGHSLSLRVPFKMDSALAALLFFEIGYVFKRRNILDFIVHIKWFKRIIAIICCLSVMAVTMIVNGMVNIANCTFNNPVCYVFGSFSGILLTLLCASFIEQNIMCCKVIAWYGRNSLAIFASHSAYLYLYEYVLSIITGKEMTLMNNISNSLSVLGTMAILVLMIPIPYIYQVTFGKLNKSLK